MVWVRAHDPCCRRHAAGTKSAPGDGGKSCDAHDGLSCCRRRSHCCGCWTRSDGHDAVVHDAGDSGAGGGGGSQSDHHSHPSAVSPCCDCGGPCHGDQPVRYPCGPCPTDHGSCCAGASDCGAAATCCAAGSDLALQRPPRAGGRRDGMQLVRSVHHWAAQRLPWRRPRFRQRRTSLRVRPLQSAAVSYGCGADPSLDGAMVRGGRCPFLTAACALRPFYTTLVATPCRAYPLTMPSASHPHPSFRADFPHVFQDVGGEGGGGGAEE